MRPEANDFGEHMAITGETVSARLFATAAARRRHRIGRQLILGRPQDRDTRSDSGTVRTPLRIL
jgi:hypothetical protein